MKVMEKKEGRVNKIVGFSHVKVNFVNYQCFIKWQTCLSSDLIIQ